MTPTNRPPGFWLPWWLVTDFPNLTWSARLIYARLAFYPRDDEGAVWCKQTDLARELDLGRATVQRALDQLDEAGLLVKVERTGEQRLANLCQRYVVHAHDDASESIKTMPSEASERCSVSTSPDQRVTTNESTPSARDARAGEVERVWDHWLAVASREGVVTDVGRWKLTPGRRDAIRARLRDGYGLDDLLAVVDSAFANPHHRSNPAYLDAASIYGSKRKVDQHLARVNGRALVRDDRLAKAQQTLDRTAMLADWMAGA